MPISGNIRKFKFDLTLANERVFEPLTNDLISLTKKSLLEVVDRVFLPFEGRNIVVDKIEIDLGNINPRDLNSLVRNFKSELEDFVQNNINESTLQNQERVGEALLFFIQKGYFPWWVDGADTFNEMLSKLSDSFKFSESLQLILTSNKKNYFRLFNILNADAKKVMYQKLLSQNELIFRASISFFERLLINYKFPKIEPYKDILEEVEFFFIAQQMTINKDSSLLFYKVLKYFSGFLSIPFSNFFRFIKEEAIHTELNQVIKSLIEAKTDISKADSSSLVAKTSRESLPFNLSEEVNFELSEDEAFKARLVSEDPLSILISFFEKGIFQVNFTISSEYGKLLELLLEKNDPGLMDYLSKKAFFNSEIRLERFFSLLSDASTQKLIDQLGINNTALLIADLDKIFSDRPFIQNLLVYSATSNITYNYKKALLIDLLISKSEPRTTSSFIYSFIQRLSKEISLESNELLFEFSKMANKKKLDQSILNIFDVLYNQISDEGQKPIKSIDQTDLEIDESSSFQLNATYVLAMSESDLAKVLLDLFKELPNSRFTLEMFVFHRDYSKALSLDLFSKVFRGLKVISGLDFSRRIQTVLKLVEPQHKNQLLLQINKVAFQIIVSRGLSMRPEIFSESLTATLFNLYPQIFKKDKPKKIKATSDEENALQQLIKKVPERSKSNLEIDESSSFQLNATYVLAMSESDLAKVLLDLFKELPNSRFTLEMFVFHRDYSKALSLDLFSKVFRGLKVISGLDFSRRIQTVLKLVEPQHKNQLLLQINKVAFQIIVSRGLSMRPEIFSESLTATLFNLYPQIFKKDKPKKIKATSDEENALQQLIKKVSERSKSKALDKQQPIDIEKFDSLLRLKHDILENQLSVIFSEEVISFQDSFTSIIASKETLLAFLNQNYLDHELIMAFSEITLQSEISKDLEKMISKENKVILDLEEEFLDMQRTFSIISLNFSSLKVILRTFLFKKIGVLNSFKKFSSPEFSIDFLENIKRENYLNFQQLAFYLRTDESKKFPSKLAKSLIIFNASSKFAITNPKLKIQLFYKDLVYELLETDRIPEWASIENFNQNDVILFIKSAINSGDKSFIDKLLSNKVIVERLLNTTGELTSIEIKKLYQLIHLKTAGFELYSVFELLETFLDKVKLSPAMSNNVYFLNLTLREALWKQTSLICFIEKLIPFIQSKSKKTKKQILTFISFEFNISKKLIELEKNVQFSNSEIIEVLKYYLEFNAFPKHLKLYEKQIQSHIKQFLLKEDYVIIELLREYKFKPIELERLFIFIPLESIIDSFDKVILKKQTLSLFLAPILRKVIKSSTFKKKSKLSLLINLATSFEFRITKTELTNFYKNFKKEDSIDYDKFVAILKDKIKTSDEEELKIQNELLENIQFSEKREELIKKETLNNIDILDYYLEIGSVNYENKSLSKNELYQIFIKSIKDAELLTKKMVFEWFKSKLKLNRLMSIIPKDDIQVIMNLIHPDLSKVLSLFSASMEQILNTSIDKLLSIKTKSDLELKIIQYWLKKNIYLDSPFHLIVHLFEEVLENNQLISTRFFKDFRDSDLDHTLETSNFIFTLKKTYDNFKNQLSEYDDPSKEGEVSQPDQEDSDTIVIQNAGLIILWPFFYRLFDKCGFLIDRKFKDDQSVQKGILMMQYLVAGSTEINENELVLNKILCGVAQRTQIDVKIELTDVELEMCDSLLLGVLKNWEKLSKSSVATLRETFLKREGILIPNELDYNLNIVKETFDMLLDTIPWNISIIQTTFMENRINIDWK